MTSKSSKKRIFFALWPSEKQRRKIAVAIEPHRKRLSGKWTARENWHITLVFIGGFPEDDLPALQAATDNVPCPAITIRFERIEYWRRAKVMCLDADFVPNELTDLVESLEKAACAFGYEPEERRYRPHMTIARKARFFDPIPLAQPVELHWTGFRLIESVSTPTGVQYRPLKQ